MSVTLTQSRRRDPGAPDELPVSTLVGDSRCAALARAVPEPRHLTPVHVANIVRRHAVRCGHFMPDQLPPPDVDAQESADIESLLAQLRAYEGEIRELRRLTLTTQPVEDDVADVLTSDALHEVWVERRALDRAAGGSAAAADVADARPAMEWTHRRAALECAISDTDGLVMTDEARREALRVTRGFVRRLATLAVEQFESIERQLGGAQPARRSTP